MTFRSETAKVTQDSLGKLIGVNVTLDDYELVIESIKDESNFAGQRRFYAARNRKTGLVEGMTGDLGTAIAGLYSLQANLDAVRTAIKEKNDERLAELSPFAKAAGPTLN